MKILILGGTGAIGYYLVNILARYGHKVFVTSRQVRDNRENVTYILGNARDNFFINEVLKNKYDRIIDFMSYPLKEYERTKVLDLLNATDQYFFLSSSRVYANVAGLITESSPRLLDVSNDTEYLRSNEYSLTKAREENVLLELKKSNWTILRPYISFAENRLQLGAYELESWFPRLMRDKSIVFSKDLLGKFTTMSFGNDVAISIAKLVIHDNTKGEIFNVTTSESNTWSDIINIYRELYEDITGNHFKITYSNESIVCKVKECKYQIIYDRAYDRRFDNSKLLWYCPDVYFTPVRDSLKKCFESVLSSQRQYLLPVRFEALQDRHLGEYTPLKYFPTINRKLGYLFYRYNPLGI